VAPPSSQVEIAQPEQLSMTTHCCCCAQSFFLEYPAFCGIQMEQQCMCCSNAAGLNCLQFEDENKAWSRGKSESKCLDYANAEKTIWQESASEVVLCCCIKGATKGWCGVEEFDPVFTQGNSLCCDYRCALPPAPETVPLGIACCGAHLWGEPMKSTGGDAAPGAAAEPAADNTA
jgi:hypothetical protein